MKLTPPQVEPEASDEDAPTQQRRNDDDSDIGGTDDESDENMDVDRPAQSADEQLAKKLVRYAISCEYSRTAIRRDGIKERGMMRILLLESYCWIPF